MQDTELELRQMFDDADFGPEAEERGRAQRDAMKRS
jgi:hypothetical protein